MNANTSFAISAASFSAAVAVIMFAFSRCVADTRRLENEKEKHLMEAGYIRKQDTWHGVIWEKTPATPQPE